MVGGAAVVLLEEGVEVFDVFKAGVVADVGAGTVVGLEFEVVKAAGAGGDAGVVVVVDFRTGSTVVGFGSDVFVGVGFAFVVVGAGEGTIDDFCTGSDVVVGVGFVWTSDADVVEGAVFVGGVSGSF